MAKQTTRGDRITWAQFEETYRLCKLTGEVTSLTEFFDREPEAIQMMRQAAEEQQKLDDALQRVNKAARQLAVAGRLALDAKRRLAEAEEKNRRLQAELAELRRQIGKQ